MDELNVFGEPLQPCSDDPLTGFFRTGQCQTGPDGAARHTVCALMTVEFLAFSKSRGNDLSTPQPASGFPGLKPGDRWCLHAQRWVEAHDARAAPRIFLQSTHQAMLDYAGMDVLVRYALDLN